MHKDDKQLSACCKFYKYMYDRDCSGKTAYSTAASKDVRNAFRRFRGVHPDRYDYVSAQVSDRC